MFNLRLTITRSLMFTAVMVILLWSASFARADDEYLEPELAFKFSARMIDSRTVEITYAIADGYYMYREHFKFNAVNARLGEPAMPEGKVKFDDTFQKNVETYRHTINIKLPVEATGTFTLNVTGQGCADKGLCYPPVESQVILSPEGVSAGSHQQPPSSSESGLIESAFKGGKLYVILPLFFMLGVGLSLTPCVWPMVPILSYIIVGEGVRVTRLRGFALSAIYAFGVAVVYTTLGIAAGMLSEGLAANFQSPWILGAFSALLVILSLSMFDVYQLQMPASLQTRLTQMSDRQARGKLLGVFVMGVLSALIVGPCVAAPLIGVLTYISQTHDPVLGGAALFIMAIGMSTPLLVMGISAGWLLPRAGLWMERIKRFFGVLLLAVALWMISPVISPIAQMLAWAVLGIGYASYLLRDKRSGWVSKVMALIFAAAGIVQLVGVSTGGRDVLAPLAHLTDHGDKKTVFVRIKSMAELDAALAHAAGKSAMLDFYADWCVSCKEMEKLTFPDPRVQAQFANMLLLQIDVTANNADDKAMLKRFHLFGPPSIIFFDKQGREIQGGRVVGYQNADKFLQSLIAASNS